MVINKSIFYFIFICRPLIILPIIINPYRKVDVNSKLNPTFYNHRINVDDILDKISSGKKLSLSDKRKLDFFQKHLNNGGNENDFEYSEQDGHSIDEREGEKFTYNLNGRPFTFTFSEETTNGDVIDYFGEIKFNGDEYLGMISADSRGYFVDYDFYSVFDEDVRLQDVLKEEGNEAEIKNFFQEEIINSIKNGYNIIVDAVAGCGKTTTSLAIAQECKEKTI